MTDNNLEIRLGSGECFSLVFVSLTSKMFCSYLPDAVAKYGPSAWIVMLLSGIFSAGLFYIFVSQNKNADELLKSSLGNGLGRFVTFVLGLYFLLYTAFNLREIIEIIKVYNFPETPDMLFALAFLAGAVVINCNGIYSVGKLSEFYLKLIIITFAAIFLLGAGQYRLWQLAPIMGFGLKSTFFGGIWQISLFTDVVILMFLVKQSGGGKSAARTGSSAILLSSVVFALSAVCYTAVFDYTASGDKNSGLVELAKNVYYGQIFQRTESSFFLMMILICAIAVCIWIFGSVHMLSTAFEIKDKRQILYITAISVFALCVDADKIPNSLNSSGLAILLIPLIALVIGKLRRRI